MDVRPAGSLDLLGWELGDNGVNVDSLLAVDLAEHPRRRVVLDGVQCLSVGDQARKVIAEHDGVTALQAHRR